MDEKLKIRSEEEMSRVAKKVLDLLESERMTMAESCILLERLCKAIENRAIQNYLKPS